MQVGVRASCRLEGRQHANRKQVLSPDRPEAQTGLFMCNSDVQLLDTSFTAKAYKGGYLSAAYRRIWQFSSALSMVANQPCQLLIAKNASYLHETCKKVAD